MNPSDSLITSIKDPRVLEARPLSSGAGRLSSGLCLLEGREAIEWALQANLEVRHVFFHAKLAAGDPFLNALRRQNLSLLAASDGILKKISDSRQLFPYIGVARAPEAGPPLGEPLVMVLDGVRDPGNIGTIVRTARAFNIRSLVSTSPSLDLFHRKTVEASRGKVFEMRLTRCRTDIEAVGLLHDHGFQVVVTAPRASQLQSAVRLQNRPVALVVGNETAGVGSYLLDHADARIQIPMSGPVESLNVGVAAGISVYELKLKTVMTMLTQMIRTTLGREVNVTGKIIQRVLDARLKQVSPYSSTQVIFLMVLACDRVLSFDQIGRDTATFGAEMEEWLHPLRREGYVRIVDGPTPTVELLPAGERLIGELWSVVESAEEDLLHEFSAAERELFLRMLRRVQERGRRLLEPLDA